MIKFNNNNYKIIVVMPAYNAAKTLEKTYCEIPKDIVDEVILVDDASSDETVKIAKKLGIKVFIHPENKGYGANQKTCYKTAKDLGADVVVMLHPDYQYDPKLIPELIKPIVEGKASLVLGSRLLDGKALSGGMPFYKYISNRLLTFIENIVLRQNLSEFHTGYRAYSRKLLEDIPFHLNSNNFVFDSEVIVQTVALGYKIEEIGVPARYIPECSSTNFIVSLIYGVQTLITLIKYIFHKWGVIKFPQLESKNLK